MWRANCLSFLCALNTRVTNVSGLQSLLITLAAPASFPSLCCDPMACKLQEINWLIPCSQKHLVMFAIMPDSSWSHWAWSPHLAKRGITSLKSFELHKYKTYTNRGKILSEGLVGGHKTEARLETGSRGFRDVPAPDRAPQPEGIFP